MSDQEEGPFVVKTRRAYRRKDSNAQGGASSIGGEQKNLKPLIQLHAETEGKDLYLNSRHSDGAFPIPDNNQYEVQAELVPIQKGNELGYFSTVYASHKTSWVLALLTIIQ